ncbi:MAG: tyrosine-type recombinase/integrase [Acidimicrobiia bacterium]
MSSVRKVRYRSGRTGWQARWRDPAGVQRAKNFSRKTDAERYLVSLESDKLRGRYADPRLGRTRVADWVAEWQATRSNLSLATRLRDEASTRNHVVPALGAIPIGQIQPIHVGQWVASLKDEGLAPATTRKAYQLFAAAMAAAVENGLIPLSPCRKVELPQIETPEMRFLEPEEVKLLAEAIDERYRVMVLTAAYSGLRFGELCALRVDRLDALRRTIRVEESLAEVRSQFIFKSPKSEASRRTVSVPGFLVEELALHLARYPDSSGLIFTAQGGGPIRRTNFRRRIWLPAVAASVGEPCTFHDLRHSHAALLIAQSEHPKVIQARLGHASIKTTLDTYGHLFDGLDEAAADRLDETWRSSDVESLWARVDSKVVDLPNR